MIALARCLVAASVAILAACDSSPDPSPNVVDPTRLTVLPATATLYSGLPTTFVLSGGTGSYIVTSSNQAVIPISGNVLKKSFVVIPSPVTAETAVTLTVRDTGTAPLASATLTVRPGTVSNNITITPTPGTDPSVPDCLPAVCTGSDAEVSVVISQGGVPLAARGVRFEVVTGDFLFITTPAGVTEVLGLSVRTTTDETGKARARFRATALVPTQTATLRIIDEGSGASQTSSFTIALHSGNAAVFFASPSSVTFTGPRTGVCASSGNAQVAVFGGIPPYTITGTSTAFTASPLSLATSGSTFNIFVNGNAICSTGSVFTVADSSGRVVTVTAANEPGADDPPPLVVAPATVTLTSCQDLANVSVAGGIRGPNSIPLASSNSGAVTVTTGQNQVTIRRTPGQPTLTPPVVTPPTPSPAVVSITDGQTTAEVQVYFQGPGALACP